MINLESQPQRSHSEFSAKFETDSKYKILVGAVGLYSVAVYCTMAVMSIGAAICFLVFVATGWGELKVELGAYKKTPLVLPTLALAVACFGSLIWAHFSGLEFLGVKPQVDLLRDNAKLWHLGFPFILAALIQKIKNSDVIRILSLWMAFAFISAVFGIVQHFVPLISPMEIPNLAGRYHATGLSGFHLSFASILSFPMSVALVMVAVSSKRLGFSKSTLASVFVALVIVTASMLTFSRTAWVATPLTVLLICVIGFKGWPRRILIAFILGGSLFWIASQDFKLRFQNLESGSGRDRIELWEANWELLKAHPILGVGWHHNSDLSQVYFNEAAKRPGISGFKYRFSSHAHNNWIDQISSTGIVGFLAFFWFCSAIITMAYRLYYRVSAGDHERGFYRTVGLGFLAGWFCFHINGMTQSNFWDAKVLHQVGWVSAITLELYRRVLEVDARKMSAL